MKSDGVVPPLKELDEFETRVYESFSYLGSGEKQESWDIDLARANVRFEFATKGPPARVSYRLFVTPNMTNRMGSLHGGCAATLVDNLSTTILIGVSKPGLFQYGGVSRNLNVTYLRPVPLGKEIRVICEVVHVGRRLALLKAEIRRVDNDELCVVADHQKANTDPESNQKL
ncbi:hypothetical protein VTN77DRAFT_7453 [Rasamsonia byssochlamydoides]|uniref:uncharacterized protein n=1 Tax=Rasamsonia byssochlamydoides TaxID=89139 RepID=UPI003743A265